MRLSRIRGLFLGALAISVAMLACNGLTGIGDLATGDNGAIDGSADGEASTTKDVGVNTPDGGTPDVFVAPPPTCTCVAPPSDGWTGPLLLLPEVNGDAGSPCPTGLTAFTTGGSTFDTPSPTCTPCACAASNTCTSITETLFDAPTCTTAGSCLPPKTVTSACTKITYCDTGVSASATPILTGGTCTPNGGAKQPAAFKQSATTCVLTTPLVDKQCGVQNLVCAPKSEGATAAKTCIVKDNADEACPDAGPYTSRLLYHSVLTDSRACTACLCATGASQCGQATVTFYTDSLCANVASTVTSAPNDCATFAAQGPFGSAKITTNAVTINTGCTPSGGAGSGNLMPDKPTTVCCLP